MLSPRIEEYLESLFKLEQEESPVRLSRLAGYLKLSAASTSEMAKRLKKMNLISSVGKRVRLTELGDKLGRQIIRRHRLSERMLTDLLGFKSHEVHEEACKLEHAISPRVVEKLSETLGNPKTCPHGHPIPTDDGTMFEEKTKPLCDFKTGERGTVARIPEEDSSVIQYLESMGISPQVEIKVLEMAPFGGPVTIEIGEVEYTLGNKLASRILVRPIKAK